MKILAIGRSEYLLNTIIRLAEDHEITGIITGPSTAESSAKEIDFKNLAQRIGCPFKLATRVDSNLLSFCAATGADVAVSVNWMSVIGQDFISVFEKGVLNGHCGNLPQYRGNAILNWALLNAENEITISVHNMVGGELDLGTIWAQVKFNVDHNDYIQDLVSKMGSLTPEAFYLALKNMSNNKPVKRYELLLKEHGFRCYPRLPIDGCINWHQSAEKIHALIRASSRPYPGAYTAVCLEGQIQKMIIWQARIVCRDTPDFGVPGHVVRNDTVTGETHVFTGAGILALQETQFSDGSPFAPGNFFKSIRMRLGLSEGLMIELHEKLSKSTNQR